MELLAFCLQLMLGGMDKPGMDKPRAAKAVKSIQCPIKDRGPCERA